MAVSTLTEVFSEAFRIKFASCPCYLTAEVPSGGQAVTPGVKGQVHHLSIVLM